MPTSQTTKALIQRPQPNCLHDKMFWVSPLFFCSGFAKLLFCTCHLLACSWISAPYSWHLVTICTKLEVFIYAIVSTWYLSAILFRRLSFPSSALQDRPDTTYCSFWGLGSLWSVKVWFCSWWGRQGGRAWSCSITFVFRPIS